MVDAGLPRLVSRPRAEPAAAAVSVGEWAAAADRALDGRLLAPWAAAAAAAASEGPLGSSRAAGGLLGERRRVITTFTLFTLFTLFVPRGAPAASRNGPTWSTNDDDTPLPLSPGVRGVDGAGGGPGDGALHVALLSQHVAAVRSPVSSPRNCSTSCAPITSAASITSAIHRFKDTRLLAITAATPLLPPSW